MVHHGDGRLFGLQQSHPDVKISENLTDRSLCTLCLMNLPAEDCWCLVVLNSFHNTHLHLNQPNAVDVLSIPEVQPQLVYFSLLKSMTDSRLGAVNTD